MNAIYEEIQKVQGERQTDLRVKSILKSLLTMVEEQADRITELESYFAAPEQDDTLPDASECGVPEDLTDDAQVDEDESTAKE